MSKRTNDLTEYAQPIAEDLKQRMGTLKHILSAGIMALNDMPPDKREIYMALAVGKDIRPKFSGNPDENEIFVALDELARAFVSVDAKIRQNVQATAKSPRRRKTSQSD